MNTNKTFHELGMEIVEGQPKVGDTAPIYGMITKILTEAENTLVVEVNYNIKLTINNGTKESIQMIKERIFEPGIFISNITKSFSESKEKTTHAYEAISTLVIFGRRQELNS
jgi:hypothetical protein